MNSAEAIKPAPKRAARHLIRVAIAITLADDEAAVATQSTDLDYSPRMPGHVVSARVQGNDTGAGEGRVLDRVAAGGSILFVGSAGVGKTHRAQVIGECLEERGWSVERVIGSSSLRTVSFGAVHHLVGDRSAHSPEELFHGALGHLERRSKQGRVLLVVDDVDGLDDGSAALVHRLAVSGVCVVATVRTPHAGEPHVVPLWKDRALERVDVAADVADTARLAESFLGLPPSDELVEALGRLTEGNPLFVRELVADGRANGSIQFTADRATLVGRLRTAGRVADLLSDRLDDLAPPAASGLEHVAETGPITASALAPVVGDSAIEQLEGRRLIRVYDHDGTPTIDVDHPLIGEVVRSRTPTMRAQRIRADVARTLLPEAISLPDQIRSVHWMLDAGFDVAPDDLQRGIAACLGRFDAAGALRFSLHLPDSFDAFLSRGEAHLRLGDLAASKAALDRAEAAATTDRQFAAVARASAGAQRWVLGDKQASRSTLVAALERISESEARGQLVADLLLGDAVDGDLRSAIDLGVPMLATPSLEEPTELSLLVSTTIAQLLTGQIGGFNRHLRRGFELAARHRTTHPAAEAQLTVTNAVLAIVEGRFDDAVATIERRLPPPRIPAIEHFACQALAQISFTRGRGGEAADLLHRIAGIDDDAFGMAALRDAIFSLVTASAGDVETSEMLSDRSRANPASSAREIPYLTRAAARRAALAGDLDRSIAIVLDAEASCGDNRAWTLPMLHEAVRFGAPEAVVDRMGEAAGSRPLPYLDGLIEHAHASAEGDGARLAEVGRVLSDIGANVEGAEATAQAAVVVRSDGDDGHAARLATRAHVVFSRTDSIWSPIMQGCEPPLSQREHDVAALAATGRSSREIAEQLFVSPRTVDNHLRQVFRKLDIAGREELTPIFE